MLGQLVRLAACILALWALQSCITRPLRLGCRREGSAFGRGVQDLSGCGLRPTGTKHQDFVNQVNKYTPEVDFAGRLLTRRSSRPRRSTLHIDFVPF